MSGENTKTIYSGFPGRMINRGKCNLGLLCLSSSLLYILHRLDRESRHETIFFLIFAQCYSCSLLAEGVLRCKESKGKGEASNHITHFTQHNTPHSTTRHTTHNTRHTTHNTQHATHNTQHTTQLQTAPAMVWIDC